MKYYYLNQTDYPHVSYPTLTDLPEYYCPDSTVRSSGCGLCAVAMVVTNLTGTEFSLIEALELSLAVNANHSPGTDMDLLAPYVAERFDLSLVMTDDPELLRQHMLAGGMAVACAAGDKPEEDYIGVFSHGGHYIAVVDIEADGEHITVLDPSQLPDKYHEKGREGKVIEDGHILHTTMSVLAEDCRFRQPEHYADGGFKAWLEFSSDRANRNRYYLFGLKGEAKDFRPCCCE